MVTSPATFNANEISQNASLEILQPITLHTFLYPPYFEERGDGAYSGISHHVVSEVFREAGYRPVFSVYPYKRTMRNFLEERDGIMMGLMEGVPDYRLRELSQIDYMVFRTRYFYNATLKPHLSNVRHLTDTKGSRVSVLSGSATFIDTIRRSRGVPVEVVGEHQVLLLAQRGRTDFAYTGTLTALNHIRNNPELDQLKFLPTEVSRTEGGLVFKPGAYPVRDKITRVLRRFHKEGRLHSIYSDALKNFQPITAEELLTDSITIRTNHPIDRALRDEP